MGRGGEQRLGKAGAGIDASCACARSDVGRLAQVNVVQPLRKAARPHGRRDIGARHFGDRVFSCVNGVLAYGLCFASVAGLGCGVVVRGIHGQRSDEAGRSAH